MAIALNGMQFDLTSGVKNRASSIWNHKYTSMISDLNCTIRGSITTYSHFEIPEFSQYQYFIDQVACLLQKAETKSFLHLILYSKEKWCELDKNGAIPKQKWCNLEREWCDLKQMWFGAKKCDSWINRTAESQSDWRDHQWFQNGYNK